MKKRIMQTKFLILGAGISGLSFAAELQDEEYLIVEKETQIGGYCRTFMQDGFVWDFAGHFFHFKNPEIESEFSELIHAEDAVFNEKCTKIYYNDALIDYPFQCNIHQLEKEEFIDCLVGLYERNTEEPRNFKEMILSKFGYGIADKFLIPYNTKLYACDLNQLDMNAMGRFFPYAEPEEIIKGFRNNQKDSYNATFYYSKRGAEAFVEQISRKVDMSRIICNAEIERVDAEHKVAWYGENEIHYEYMISTIPFDQLLRIMNKKSHSAFSSNQVLVFNIGFDKDAIDKTLHWVYYPQKDISFYRVGFYNNIMKQSRLSIYVELGFPSDVKVDPKEWEFRVINDLRKVGIIRDHKVIAKNVLIMNPAYVHIREDSLAEKEQIKAELAAQNIYVSGRYGDWQYCSIEDCIIQARELSGKIRNHGL